MTLLYARMREMRVNDRGLRAAYCYHLTMDHPSASPLEPLPVDPDYQEPQVYEKLVRDRIPEHIMRIGIHTPIVRTVPPEEIVRLLRNKLAEEVHEYEAADAAKRVMELADILEVLTALCGRLGIQWDVPVPAADKSLLGATTAMAHTPDATNAAQLFAQLQREAEAQGIPWNEVKRVRAERAAERGVYNDGVYLERTIWTRDPQEQRPTT